MTYIQGQSRHQATLFPQALDELIAIDSPIRVIDAYVNSLDLVNLDFQKAVPASTGRPPYDPGDLLKIYIYGYLNQIRSSRRLEREAVRNIELIWLLNRLTPDFKTIANFRKDNAAAIVTACRVFTQFCRDQGLFGRELVAIDGSKFQAVASNEAYLTRERIDKQQLHIDRKINEYILALDAADSSEPPVAENADIISALAALNSKQEQLREIKVLLDMSGEKQHIVGEPEAKIMRCAHGETRVSYNIQTVVDERHKLITDFEVTNAGNDHGQLYPMAIAAKNTLGVDRLTVLADAGYENAESTAFCENAGITAVVPMNPPLNTRDPNLFSKTRFVYDSATNTHLCPAGEQLKPSELMKKNVYRYQTPACPNCMLRSQCTDAKYRRIIRHVHAGAAERAHRRTVENPLLMRKRASIVEHPFAGLKRSMGLPRFLVRGIKKVRAEMALSVLAYNLKRVMNILGTSDLLRRIEI